MLNEQSEIERKKEKMDNNMEKSKTSISNCVGYELSEIRLDEIQMNGGMDDNSLSFYYENGVPSDTLLA